MPGLDLGAVADHRAGVQHRARADPRAGADLDRADDQLLPLDPPAAHVDVALDGRAGADPQQRTGRRNGRQPGAVADLRADEARVASGPRRAAEALVAGHLGEAIDEPQPCGEPGVARVAAGLDVAQQHAGGDELHRDVRGWAGEQDPCRAEPDPADVRRADVDEVAVHERAEQPRHALDGEQDQHPEQLQGAEPARAVQRELGDVARAWTGDLLEALGEVAQAPVLIHVGDGDRRMLDAQHRGQLGGRQRRAAEREEVAVGTDRDRSELLAPARGKPPLGVGQGGVGAGVRRRPRQRLAVDLAGCRNRQRVEHHDHRDQARRHPLGDVGAHRVGLH